MHNSSIETIYNIYENTIIHFKHKLIFITLTHGTVGYILFLIMSSGYNHIVIIVRVNDHSLYF